jgi:acyl-CoA thioester hydrolase
VDRIQLLDEVDMPYRDYLALGLHYAVRKLDVHYKRAARYDDVIETTVWVQWVRGASLGIGYELRVDDAVIATAATEHAMVDNDGRPTRIPRERRANLTKLAASA